MSNIIPTVKESSKFNFVTSIWIVPFIALVIAGWLGYQYFAQRGVEIEILFPKNEGLVAGQSVVKYKNVPIGKVTNVYIEKNVQGVIAVVRMNTKKSTPFLTEHARFWIVKPEVGLGGISGLDTLISGTYIEIYSQKGGKELKKKFIGLTQTYRDENAGNYFHLLSKSGDSISVGTPIFYKNIKVGEVEYVHLSLDSKGVDVIVFVNKQFVSLIHNKSKFWVKSMVSLDLSKGGLDLSIAPLNYMVQGGIVFSSPEEGKDIPLDKDKIFQIYTNKAEAKSITNNARVKNIKKFTLTTYKETANLKVNSPVRFTDFDIGEVKDIKRMYNSENHQIMSNILISINMSFFKNNDSSGLDNFYKSIDDGMRANIDTINPITGMQYVDLTFNHSEGNGTIVKTSKYAQLPMVTKSSEGIMSSVNKIMDKIAKLPLDKLVNSFDKVINDTSAPIAQAEDLLKELKKSVININKMTSQKAFIAMPNEVNNTLKELTKTLKKTGKVVDGYSDNSMLTRQLSYTLEVLTKTSREMDVFLRMLNRKPNSLIFGE